MSVALQDMSPYARSIVERLGLETHPEGGWYTRDWQSPHTDEASSRPLSSLIYFLLPEGDASAWHKVDADEVWLWHGPASVKLELGGSDDYLLREKELLTAKGLDADLVDKVQKFACKHYRPPSAQGVVEQALSQVGVKERLRCFKLQV